MSAVRSRVVDTEGSASVLGVALVAAIVVLLGILAPLCAAYQSRQVAAGAADAAALAAADTALGFTTGDPCAVASRAAQLNGATLESCAIDGLVATVQVSVNVMGLPAIARAKAGPDPHQSVGE